MSALLLQIDAALASATQRSGHWLACRPGCHQCCIGVFPISPLDAETLRSALRDAPPELAARIRTRAAASRARLTPNFPGDPLTGQLFTQPHHEVAFETFADDEPCPVLDPITGTCDLYAARPIPCRTFGPPVRQFSEDTTEDTTEDTPTDPLTVCELCFIEAPASEVARCELDQSWRPLEDAEIAAATARALHQGPTLIAFALTEPQPSHRRPGDPSRL
jgi:Fe-S-cluster containining protein